MKLFDVLIAATRASLNLPLVGKAWFERSIADFGQSTGVTATGLLPLRMADPYRRSPALETFCFKQLVYESFLGGGLITAFAPIALMALGLPLWTLLALAITAACLAFGAAMARQPRAGSAAP